MEYMVVRLVPGSKTDHEPIHPGHMSKTDAWRLKRAMQATGIACTVWTTERWNREEARIAEEVFCDCGEEREICRCPKSSEDHWRDNYLLPGSSVR